MEYSDPRQLKFSFLEELEEGHQDSDAESELATSVLQLRGGEILYAVIYKQEGNSAFLVKPFILSYLENGSVGFMPFLGGLSGHTNTTSICLEHIIATRPMTDDEVGTYFKAITTDDKNRKKQEAFRRQEAILDSLRDMANSFETHTVSSKLLH